MPMRYANENDVLTQLGMTRLDAGYARLVRVENGLCNTFDAKTGRSFGVTPVPEWRTVNVLANGTYAWRIVLETPVRRVLAVEIDGVEVPDDRYHITNTVRGVSYMINLSAAFWGGDVRIRAIWADQPEFDVPDDVREALTFLTVDTWRLQEASPSGLIGPEGMSVRPRNPWNFETVTTAIERHQVARILV